MAIKLSALAALCIVSPASAGWMVQPFPDYSFSPFLVSPFVHGGARPLSVFEGTRRLSLFDQHFHARHLYASPFSTLEPLKSTFSSTLELLDGLQRDELAPSWKEHDEHLVARLLVRGLEASDLKAVVSDGLLTVRGERGCNDKCKTTVVRRSMSLPFEVTDATKIALSLSSEGVLTVKVPKATRASPDKAVTPLQIVAAEEEKKSEALPAPTPAAVEAETLRALEAKFPQAAPLPPSDSSEAPTEAKKTSEDLPAEPPSATETLRKVINTAVGATSMAAAAGAAVADGGDLDAKNISVEAATATPVPETATVPAPNV